jgi:uncharacterized protein (TIGR03435 family)
MKAWNLPLAAMSFAVALVAQQQLDKIEFEVVSIKPADPTDPAHMSQSMPGGFRGRNLRLFELIMSAWHLNRDQLIGGPNWMETSGWDIDTRFPTGMNPAQVRQMMQAMLADRFRLVAHRETRTLAVYALTVAKSGIKLHEGDGSGGMSAGPRLIRYGSGTMGELASQLSNYLGREVIDRTDLTGQYTINLSFAPVSLDASAEDRVQDLAPSIFQALQDQAGLRLESSKGPVEVLIIDHAEAATPN